MGVLDFWVLFILLGFWFQAQVLNSQSLTCNPDDLRALEGFLEGLESRIVDWSSNSSSDCCSWDGIECNNDSRVVRVQLGSRKLKGNLSDSLAGLDQLKTLNLSYNFFTGSVPSQLLQLQNLEILDFSFNAFHGLFPADTNLPSIKFIDMTGNEFSGPLNADICNNSIRIRVMNFSLNNFSGVIPLAFSNCASLEYLSLKSNFLTGNLPRDLFQLPKLSRLYLQDNSFSGSLSDGIRNLSNLVELDISFNGFSGILPDVFGGLRKLQSFSAHSNQFTGHLPTSLSNSPSLSLLSLRNNSFSGSIDLNCSAMVSLTSLDLGSNKFRVLPDSLPSCRKLVTINLARNNFSSQIPESYKDFQALSYLSISNSSLHNISSALGILQNCRNLTILVLTMNFYGEEIPSNRELLFNGLRALIIANGRLTGSFPPWVRASTKLQLLDLSWNQLGGMIPDWLGGLNSLFYIDLSNNSFFGEIPRSLTKLENLIFNHNISLADPSPDFAFFIKRNRSATGLQYNQILSFPPTLDLSSNKLTGPIWPEFGNLKKIHVLDLSWNSLSGPIPGELSGMTSLENLDLSHNNLSGTIPPSLTNLTFLAKFSVAYNQLVGKIPSDRQFLTFPNSSFEGNSGLCGEHYSHCWHNQIPRTSANERRKKGNIIGMSLGIGVGAFILAFVILFMLRTQSRRQDDPEKVYADTTSNDLEQLGSRLVVLFQHKDNNKELSIDDLLKSTNNFDQANIIGCGGFGLVYKATLPDGRNVAIKRLSGDCGQVEREFQAEVEALSRAQHGNLVLLQGYCRHKNDRLLIYSYMENGSLDYWLHEKFDGAASLDWETRLQIAQGAARGLAYLHQSCQPHILHRDIKSSNILLDENFEAHLADFGLARLILPYDTHVTTDLVGTLGYIPPEYGQASVATYKGDVYSFGVVLLELLTGRRPMDMCKPKGCRDLISWVLQLKKEKRETEIFDPFIYDKQHDKEMLRLLQIACLCLSENPKERPSTHQLVSWLDNVDLDS